METLQILWKAYGIDDVLLYCENDFYCPIDTIGDGNCFYRALCLDNSIHEMFHDHRQLRMHIIDGILLLLKRNDEEMVCES